MKRNYPENYISSKYKPFGRDINIEKNKNK
jgi:hypothetical protein